jgi:hypothetical protein
LTAPLESKSKHGHILRSRRIEGHDYLAARHRPIEDQRAPAIPVNDRLP